MKGFLLIALTLSLISCTNTTGITPDGTDAYRIMITGDTGFTNSATLQKSAYDQATAYCSNLNQVVETISMDSKQARPFGGWPEATLRFKCVTRNQ